MPPRKSNAEKVDTEAPLAEAQTGDGGARDEEVSTAMAELETASEELDLGEDRGAIIAALTDHLVELFKRRPKPWSQLSQQEQRDLIAAAEQNAKDTVRQVVEAVARNGREAVRCLMVGFTDKGDDIKVELKVKALSRDETEAAVMGLHRARGKHVLLTVASAEDYHEKPANDRSEADQPALGFEASDDELVQPGELSSIAPTKEPAKYPNLEDTIHTGDSLVIGGKGICAARINLKTSMVEGCPPDHEAVDDAPWFDVREATAEELAAERDRIADFDDEGADEAETV